MRSSGSGGSGAPARLLVVEDRDSLRRMLERALRQEGYEVASAADGREGIRRLRQEPCDLVLTDLKLPGADGLEVLRAAREQSPPVPVVVMTAYGSVAAAVEAMKLGAIDFLEKPVEIDDLYRLVASVVGPGGQAPPGASPESFVPAGGPAIVGRHPRLRAALRLLERVAPTEGTVLLTGESGTGKELFARALHALSPRRAGPFVAVNCAAIPESLLENELFGHERGAFTGADRRHEGRFAAAQAGTLLLDEIADLPLGVQAKVLRVLEERTYERVGGGPTLRADVRLVAATNRDLRTMVEGGAFRSDLFFRLEVFPIEIPPLRERPSDVPLLAAHLLAEAARRHGRAAPALEPSALALLAAQPWPGNVRELAHVVERALVLCEAPLLRAADLAPLLQPLGRGGERERVRQALAEAQGDKRRAAERLGVSYRTLLRRVKEYDLEGFPRYRG
jgi:DNA-binding NtrC family response regulator